MLKADLHIHTKEDPHDRYIRYNAKQLIDHAYNMGFDVLAITHHWYPGTSDRMFYPKKMVNYAGKKGILLIPGVEARLKVKKSTFKKDVLLYNFSQDELNQIKTLDDIRRIKQPHHMVIAPHPFFPHPKMISLGGKLLERYIDIFDAIEHAYFYLNSFNFNLPAVEIARKYKKTIVGNSDVHQIKYIGTNYSLIKAKPSIESVIQAVKSGRVKLKTQPIRLYDFSMRTIPMAMEIAYNLYEAAKNLAAKKKNL